MADILNAAAGRWPELLSALCGLTPDQLTDRHQPCPSCGGKDRYRWDKDDAEGGWFCNQCGGKDQMGGAGSGIDLLMRVNRWDLKQALAAVERYLGLPPSATVRPAKPSKPHRTPEKPPPGAAAPVLGRAVAQWCYRDTAGEQLFWIQRFNLPDGRKLFFHRVWLDNAWHHPRKTDPFTCEWPAPRPLYRLPDLSDRPDAPVLVVEGEKAADAAAALFPAHVVVSWSNGSKAIDKVDWQPLKRRRLTLWPDADAPGKQAMARLAERLATLAASVAVVDPPADLPQGWDLADATDWTPAKAADVIANHSRVVATAAEADPTAAPPASYRELLALALDAVREDDEDREMEIRAEIMTRFRRNDGQITAALFRLLSAQMQQVVTEKPTYRSIDLSRVAGIDWLLEGFIPDNDQALLFAPAGAGKTTAALGMAFAVTDGTGFLDHDAKAASGNVLLIASDSGAGPLIRTLAEMGRGDDPALRPSPEDNRLHVWAHDPEQGAMAWEASLKGCLKLLEFVQAENIRLVLIDSCKAVTSKADVNYCDNGQVTALLTFCKEVLCQHCAVVWINHEGTGAGEAAGAKAWKEIPSIVHSIEPVAVGAEEDGNGRKTKTARISTTMRSWRVRKCRQGTAREFLYQVDGLTGRLVVSAAVEVKRDCRALIVDVLYRAQQNGRPSLSLKAIAEELLALGGYSRGTVSNSLTRMTGARYPEVVRVGNKPGHYRLAPRIVEQLDEAAKAEASS